MEIRKIKEDDLEGLLQLYTQLHDNPYPDIREHIQAVWREILADKNHYIFVGKLDDKIISSCVLIIVPNLTHGQRPYAFIENVITDVNYRGKGYATKMLSFAQDIARKKSCYKIMLMTGSKKETTLNFYKSAGYNSEDKTAFVQWL